MEVIVHLDMCIIILGTHVCFLIDDASLMIDLVFSATYAPPEEVTWHYWVVGACVIVLVILLTLVVVVPYILWRNRVILVMKVVHYFQGYEDDGKWKFVTC